MIVYEMASLSGYFDKNHGFRAEVNFVKNVLAKLREADMFRTFWDLLGAHIIYEHACFLDLI